MSIERRPAWRRFGRTTARILAVMVVCLPIFVAATAVSGAGLLLFGDLPGTRPDPRPRFEAQPSTVYDVNGEVIGEFREFDLTIPMTQADVPQVLKDAVVASEDSRFWEHEGFDPEGLARAALANYRNEDIVQGGSTITQQLVRERYLTREQTVERKINELILATRFERDLAEELGSEQAAKEQILFEYLDSTYFGGGAYGAAAAAQTYFRKDVWNLTLSEAATLAGVIPAPSDFGPRDDVVRAEQNRRIVLQRMLELGLITTAEFDEAFAQVLWYAPLGWPPGPATVFHPPPEASMGTHPYFLDYVRKYMTARYGSDLLFRGGLEIHTTIDPHLQALAQDAVTRGLEGTAPPTEMSLVSVEPSTGFVKALIGGRDFNANQVNLALGGTMGFQPGSSFKAFTVATALEEGYSPDVVYDAPAAWNCDGGCNPPIRGGAGGAITMRAATAASTNTFFAKLATDLGPAKIAAVAHRLGVTSMTPDKEYNVTITLGAAEVAPLDMAAAFSVFANHGVKASATPIVYVHHPDGTMIEDNRGPRGERVLHQAVADHTTDLLRGPVERGTGRRAAIGRPTAGKTGSTDDNKDAWFVGYTPQLATAVWMGHSDTPKTIRVAGRGVIYGGDLPAQTFSRFMGPAHENLPVVDFAVPGPLPAPSSGIRRIPRSAGMPTVPQDCSGPCYAVPTVTTPPMPEPEADVDPQADVDPATTAGTGGDGDEGGEPGSTTTTAVPPDDTEAEDGP